MIQTHDHGILKLRFFLSRMIFLVLSVSNCGLCLIIVGFIIRVLVVLQKTNNVVVRYRLCQVPSLGSSIFDKRSALFVTLCQLCLKFQVDLAIFANLLSQLFQVTLLDHLMFCNLQNTYLQNISRKKTIRRLCLKIKFFAIFT